SGHAGEVTAVAFSGDGRRALSGGLDRTLRLWDLSGAQAPRVLPRHAGPVTAVPFPAGAGRQRAPPAGRRRPAARGGRAAGGQGRDVEAGEQVRLCGGHAGAVWALAAAPDGKWFVSAGEDRVVKRWDLGSGRLLARWPEQARIVRGLAVSPDGRQVVAAALDGTLRVGEGASGRGGAAPRPAR